MSSRAPVSVSLCFRKPLCLMLSAALAALPMSSSAGLFDFKEGGADAPVGGSASTDGAKGEASSLEKCAKPIGTMAVAEPQDFTQKALANFKLASPTGLIRLMMQQSNCFVVVERGVAMQNMLQERMLAEKGYAKSGSNVGKGQIVTADYLLTPDVVFSEGNTGGVGGALGGIGSMFGVGGAIVGAVAAGVKFKQAQTSMMVADARSGVQVAAASGSAEKADFGMGGFLAGAGGFGALGGYTNTPEGKVVAVSFLDNYNQIVRAMRGDNNLARTQTTTKHEASNVAKAVSAVFDTGDVLSPKIAGVKVFANNSGSGKVVKTLSKADEVVVTGENDQYVKVQGSGFEGWAEKNLMKKQ